MPKDRRPAQDKRYVVKLITLGSYINGEYMSNTICNIVDETDYMRIIYTLTDDEYYVKDLKNTLTMGYSLCHQLNEDDELYRKELTRYIESLNSDDIVFSSFFHMTVINRKKLLGIRFFTK